MSAVCDCGWTGTATQVRDGGRCPECDSPIRYESKSLPDLALKTVSAFNKRALIALRAAALTEWDKGFISSITSAVEHYVDLTPQQQNTIYRMVNRHARDLHDIPVVDFAVLHARGAD